MLYSWRPAVLVRIVPTAWHIQGSLHLTGFAHMSATKTLSFAVISCYLAWKTE